MNLPSRRQLGATALVIAAVGAFLVPFLIHSNAKPASPTAPGGGNNNGGGTTTSSGDNHENSGSNDSSETCTATASSSTQNADTDSGSHKTGDGDHRGNGRHNGNAFGLVKNKLDATVALVKAMGSRNPAFHLHHSTDTDNDAGDSHTHVSHSSIESNDDCDTADTENEDD